MTRLKREQILKQKEGSFAKTVAISILAIISILLSIVSLASVIGVFYAFGLSVVGYILLLSLVNAIFTPNFPITRVFDVFSDLNKNVDADSEHELHITEDENPVYIGGRKESNFTDREDRKVEPGEKVTLKRESSEEVSVEGAVTDTISTEGGTVTKVEEKFGSDTITHINLSETSGKKDTDTEENSNTEVVEDSTKDSGVSPVAGVILMTAVAVVIVSVIAIIAFIALTSVLDSQLLFLEQYVVPLVIVSVVAPPVVRFIQSGLKSADILTEVRLETYIDDNEEDQGKVVTVDMEGLEYHKYIAVPNDSNPVTWEEETTLSKEEPKIHFFSDVVDSPGAVEVDGKPIHPINQYGACNAKYDTIEKLTIYNSEYEELFSVSVPT